MKTPKEKAIEYLHRFTTDSKAEEAIDIALKAERERIKERLNCPEVNECEDYQEAYEVLVKHIEEIKEELKQKLGME